MVKEMMVGGGGASAAKISEWQDGDEGDPDGC